MLSSMGKPASIETRTYLLIMVTSEGAANLNDMKEMLASLPQYQEQREKVVLSLRTLPPFLNQFSVLTTSQYGARLHGHIRT